MSKRRAYQKVRGGCLTCKARKVRCTLERPSCRNCWRLSRECTYPAPAEQPREISLLPFFKTEDDRPSRPEPVYEIQLMHHYTAHTCLTMTNSPVLHSLWKDAVPKHAFQHRFLLQGILALAARHRLQEIGSSSTDLVDVAYFYEQAALSSYIHLLNHVTKENCHALFAFSQLIVGIYYSRLSVTFQKQIRNPQEFISSIIDIFQLLKGTLALTKETVAWLRSGDLNPMVGPKPEARLAVKPYVARNSYIIEALSALEDRISSLTDNSVESKTREESLLSTIQLLYAAFLEDCESEDRLNIIIGLPVFFDPHYIMLLRERDHAALTVLSYYGIALRQIRHVWFLNGIGAEIVESTADLVDRDWLEYANQPGMETREAYSIMDDVSLERRMGCS